MSKAWNFSEMIFDLFEDRITNELRIRPPGNEPQSKSSFQLDCEWDESETANGIAPALNKQDACSTLKITDRAAANDQVGTVGQQNLDIGN